MITTAKNKAQATLTPEQEAKQARILREGTCRDAYFFAQEVPGADIQALQEVALTRGDDWDAYLFARDISGADVPALQERVITRGGAVAAYHFARYVPGAFVQPLEEAVLTRGNSYGAYSFAVDIPGADVLACVRRIAALDPQDKEDCLRILREKHPEVLTPEVLATLSLGVTL